MLLLVGTVGLAACNSSPKFRNPAISQVDKLAIHSQMLGSSGAVGTVNRGDTLEVVSIDPSGMVQVRLDARKTPFAGGETSGYVLRRFLTIPESTLAKVKH